MDGWTDERTGPLIEMRGRNWTHQKIPWMLRLFWRASRPSRIFRFPLLLRARNHAPPNVLPLPRQARRRALRGWETFRRSYLTPLWRIWLVENNNNLVLVVETTPRHEWPLARVTQIFHDVKGHVRRIMLTNARRREFERHVTGVVPLEVVDNDKNDNDDDK